MGFFAFFCGLHYNDFLSISPNLFGSCYEINNNDNVIKKPHCTYPIGVDPI